MLTRTLNIETRQHELLGFDFGEGPPRAALIFGGSVLIVWFGVLFALFGFPSPVTIPLYLIPPAALAMRGWQEDRNNPRRRVITSWVLSARNVMTGQKPIVALGRHDRPHDSANLWNRLGVRFGAGDPVALLIPSRVPKRYGIAPDPTTVARTDSIRFAPQVRHISTDRAIQLAAEREQRLSTRRARRQKRPVSLVKEN